MTRQIFIVDTETSGRSASCHEVVEVAWLNLDTDERGCFIPPHSPSRVLAGAEIAALRINRYIDRLADAPQDLDGIEARRLAEQLEGNTLAGSNPAFDAAFLTTMFEKYYRADLLPRVPTWHYRLWDLSPWAAGVLGLDELPGLAAVCERLHIEPGDHTAEGDVTATALCFMALRRVVDSRASKFAKFNAERSVAP